MHIAVLETDPVQRESLRALLEDAQHTVRSFGCLGDLQQGLSGTTVDFLLVDWVLPDATGAEAIQWIRRNVGWRLPVIVVAAQENEATVVAALDTGADDFIVKPPRPLELLARIVAAARRSQPQVQPLLHAGACEIDLQHQQVRMSGQPVSLTQQEFDLAVVLFQSPGKALSRHYLLDKVWGHGATVAPRTVDTHVSRLRRKLLLDGSQGWRLAPIHGFGYRFDRVDIEDC